MIPNEEIADFQSVCAKDYHGFRCSATSIHTFPEALDLQLSEEQNTPHTRQMCIPKPPSRV